MNKEKFKILKMLEEDKINSHEALELLQALDDGQGSASVADRIKRKGKDLNISLIVSGQERGFSFPIDEILLSALMNKINSELKYNDINLFVNELKTIKDRISKGSKVVLDRENISIRIWVK